MKITLLHKDAITVKITKSEIARNLFDFPSFLFELFSRIEYSCYDFLFTGENFSIQDTLIAKRGGVHLGVVITMRCK